MAAYMPADGMPGTPSFSTRSRCHEMGRQRRRFYSVSLGLVARIDAFFLYNGAAAAISRIIGKPLRAQFKTTAARYLFRRHQVPARGHAAIGAHKHRFLNSRRINIDFTAGKRHARNRRSRFHSMAAPTDLEIA